MVQNFRLSHVTCRVKERAYKEPNLEKDILWEVQFLPHILKGANKRGLIDNQIWKKTLGQPLGNFEKSEVL